MKLFFAQNSRGQIVYRAEVWYETPHHHVFEQSCFYHDYTMDLSPEQARDIQEKGWTDIPPPDDYFEPIPALEWT